MWERVLGDASDDLLDAASARYPVTGGVIVGAGASARARVAAHGVPMTISDVHDAVRGVIDTRLGGLGTRITTSQEWDDIVLPDDVMAEVREMVARSRHRRQVYEEWGFRRKLGRGLGLSALFSGPPGGSGTAPDHSLATLAV